MNLIKVYNLNERNIIYKLDDIFLFRDNTILIIKDEKFEPLKALNEFVFARNTRLKYTEEDKYIYEYDLIDLTVIEYTKEVSYTGIVLFKKGEFYLKDIRKNGDKIGDRIYLKTFFERKDVISVKNIGSIIKFSSGIDYVRNTFRYEVPNEYSDLKNICIDKEGKLFNLDKELLDNQIEIESNILLSTDFYDSTGELIYENDKVEFKRINRTIKGIVKLYRGSYIISDINIDKDIGVVHLNNDLNKIKISNIKRINQNI